MCHRPHVLVRASSPTRDFKLTGFRIVGTLGDPAPYTSTLMFMMLFLLHYAMNQPKRIVRGLLISAVGLGIFCIFLSFSRGSWLAGALTLVALLVLYPKPILTLILITLPVIIGLSTTVLANEVAYASQRLNTENTVESRLILAHAGEQMFLAKPLLGWGYDNYDRYDWRFIERVENAAPTTWDIQLGTSHNTYLTILAEIGAVGFLFYTFPAIWWLYLTFRVLPRLPKEGFWSWRLLIMMWLSVGFHIVVSQFMDMRFFLFSTTLLWLTLGLIANMVQSYLKPGDIGPPTWAVQAARSGVTQLIRL
jgi:O-antigen ligase